MLFPKKVFSFSGVAALWVATLYFAQGLPNAIVDLVAPVAMKDLGFSNSAITFVAAWAYLPWVLKALWSPLVDSIGKKRSWILNMQIAGALALTGFAGTLFFNAPAVILVGVLFSVAVLSATHDIAADGFYMLALDSGHQAFFSGWRSTFFRLSQVFAKGGIIAAAGFFIAGGTSPETAWMQVFLGIAFLTGTLALTHAKLLPRPQNDVPARTERTSLIYDFSDTWKTFFKKERIGFLLFFLLFFRFGEVQIGAISPLFFKDSLELGGLSLDNRMFGLLNGTFGVIALLAGGVLAGWLVSRNGLRAWLWQMILLLNLPDFIYVAFAHWQPDSSVLIGSGIVIEQFGYGFGFTGYMLYMLYACAGTRRAVAHYAICTGIMALGVMIPKFWSGALQQLVGYENFFWWSILCTLPGFWIVAKTRKFLPDDFGKKLPAGKCP